MRSFASDNNSGIHPRILDAIARANTDHCVAYGDDPHTESAEKKFREVFGQDTSVFFVFNGTGANITALSALARPYQAVLCSEHAHIHLDECGAPERFAGTKLIPVSAPQGKLTVDAVRACISGVGNQHHVQPKVISLTQVTELGTVYTIPELREIVNFAHQAGLLVHMDGARLSNAAASLDVNLRQITADVGIDALSFGGTKNGLLGAEAVVLFRPELAQDFKFIRKQGAQLSSKTRFLSAQFSELLSDELWKKNASHANRMARLLEAEVRKAPSVEIVYPVQANAVFAKLNPLAIAELKKTFFFYTWNEKESVVRWMTSFDTTEDDVQSFAKALRLTSS